MGNKRNNQAHRYSIAKHIKSNEFNTRTKYLKTELSSRVVNGSICQT